MKLAILILAQIIGTNPGPLDQTPKYVISPVEQRSMTILSDAYNKAHAQHQHERGSEIHHKFWQVCQQAIKESGLPQTAACDIEKGIVRGKDSK
jgi:hypothetical protein